MLDFKAKHRTWMHITPVWVENVTPQGFSTLQIDLQTLMDSNITTMFDFDAPRHRGILWLLSVDKDVAPVDKLADWQTFMGVLDKPALARMAMRVLKMSSPELATLALDLGPGWLRYFDQRVLTNVKLADDDYHVWRMTGPVVHFDVSMAQENLLALEQLLHQLALALLKPMNGGDDDARQKR